MGFFNKIISSIFGYSTPVAATIPPVSGQGTPPPASTTGGIAAIPPIATPASVDVDEVLTAMAAKNSEKLDWKHSIVDLLKVLDIDSSLSARKELAAELNYKGDTSDSATMNIWLHKEVCKKLAENGGKVPTNLLD